MRDFISRLRAALLAAKRVGPHGAGAPSERRSDGYEFAELRGYVEGDDPRRIDWAATARAGTLQTRVMFEERSLVLAAVIDGSGSMRVGRDRTNFELASAAAALWYGVATADDRCARIDRDAFVPHALRGRAAARACLTRDEGAPDLERALRLAAAALPRGALLLVASDFYDLDRCERTLRACATRFDLTALVVADPWADGLPLAGFVRLRDAESGAVSRAFVSRTSRERFVAAVERRERDVLARVRACGARATRLDARGGSEAALARVFGL